MGNTEQTAVCHDNPKHNTEPCKELSGQVVDIGKWMVSSPPRKRCGMSIHLRNRADKRNNLLMRVLCGRWACEICGPYLKTKWQGHLSIVLGKQETIFIHQITPTQWEKIKTRIRRAKGEYAHIKLNSGVWAVFTNVPVGGSPLSQSATQSILDASMNSVSYDRKPIATSRGWSLSLNSKPTKSEWERVGTLTADIEEIEKVVVELVGDQVRSFYHANAIGFYVLLPQSWDDAHIAEFDRRLLAVGKVEL